MNWRLISFLGLLISSLCSEAATFHVAQRHQKASDDAAGTVEAPWKTISRAAAQAAPGDVVLLHSGVYRERVVMEKSGTADALLRFEEAPGEHVVLTGADRVTGWRKDSDLPIYSVSWPHRFVAWSRQMTHPGDEYHRLIGRCEQVIVDGYLLRQVLEAGQLAPGSFYVDVTNQNLRV